MKKEVKKQIKEDKFIDTVNLVVDFVTHRKKEMMMGLAAILGILVIFIGIKILNAGSVKKENQVLTQILSLTEELKDKPENVEELEKLAGKGKFSRMAYIQLANYHINNKDFARAEEELKKIPENKKDLLYMQSRDILAQVYLYQKKFDEALTIYDTMERDPGEFSLDILLFNKASVFEEKGETDRALEIYKRVESDFSQTYFGYEASQKVKELEEK
ncbi:tetratricopeptide repeat protein [Acidobacteriota bacterium]